MESGGVGLTVALSEMYEKTVVTSDKHQLGQVVNLLIDMSTGHANIVVFPKLLMKLIRTQSGNIAGQVAGQAVGTLKHLLPGADIAGILIDQLGGHAGMRAGSKVKDIVSVIEERYYLVPIEFLRNVASDAIDLEMSYEDCKKWFLNATPVPEAYMAFYEQSKYTGSQRKVMITLNMPTLEHIVLQDGSGVETVVTDSAIAGIDNVKFSVDNKSLDRGAGTVSLVVNDPRPEQVGGQIARLIDIRNVVRQGGARLYTQKTLNELPKFES
jgi:sporulation protein YlmC with PRC-barrel domain